MRLGFPRIESLQTDDGAASITFLKVNMDRDTGGLDYLFRFKTPSSDIEVRSTVAIVTGIPASKKFAESGNELWSLHPTDVRKYIEEYAGEYGNTFEVRIFEVPSGANDSSIVALRDAFCELFFEYWSSYKYNSADKMSAAADFYPDTLIFVPFDLDRKFHVTLHVRQGA